MTTETEPERCPECGDDGDASRKVVALTRDLAAANERARVAEAALAAERVASRQYREDRDGALRTGDEAREALRVATNGRPACPTCGAFYNVSCHDGFRAATQASAPPVVSEAPSPLTVACPHCRAAKGLPCFTGTGLCMVRISAARPAASPAVATVPGPTTHGCHIAEPEEHQFVAVCDVTSMNSGGAATDTEHCNKMLPTGWASFPGETAAQRAVRYLDERCKGASHVPAPATPESSDEGAPAECRGCGHLRFFHAGRSCSATVNVNGDHCGCGAFVRRAAAPGTKPKGT